MADLKIKLYSEFYDSDIIVASPLALRMISGQKMDDKARDITHLADRDFLASIEYVVLD